MSNEYLNAMLDLLYGLTGLRKMYDHMHWHSSGENFYTLHLLFERIYDDMDDNSEIDALAEKIIGVFGGQDIFNAVDEAKEVGAFLETHLGKTKDTEKFLQIAIEAENHVLNMIETIMGMADEASDGVQNMVQGLYDNHETNIYLLKQMKKEASSIPYLVSLAKKMRGEGQIKISDDILDTIKIKLG